MTRSELQDYGAENPIWGFVQRLATERWTGQAVVGIDPRVELFLDEGHVYVAQRADDAPLGARLLAVGALSAEQLRTGGVHLGDTVSLARLFQRDPSVDRDTVELTVDRFTEQLLEQVAEHPVGDVALHPLRHHPSGVHQWRERRAAPMETDEAAMSALVQAVVSLSGEVPVVRADLVTAPAGVASSPRLAEPTESPMTFEPVVTPHVDVEPALPTLASLDGLTPLPTLGASPAPAPAPAPAPVAHATSAPTLTPAAPAIAPAAPTLAPPVPPAPAVTAPAVAVAPAAPAMTPPPIGAMMAAPVPGANAAGAPPEGEAEEIWDMVDELLGLPHTTPTTPTTTASDKKSRGWLRGRKG